VKILVNTSPADAIVQLLPALALQCAEVPDQAPAEGNEEATSKLCKKVAALYGSLLKHQPLQKKDGTRADVYPIHRTWPRETSHSA